MSRPLPAQSLPATDEAAHLRLILDRQPACMMRVGCDGTLLAVNDAALSLFGAEALAQILETPLTDRLIPEHHPLWREFAARVWSEGPGSVECDLVDRAGAVRPVRLQAIAIPEHPDGIRSLLVSARDLSSTRRLEQALQDTEATSRVVEETRAALSVAQAERNASQAAAAESQRAAEALRTELDRSIAEQRQLTDDLVQRDHAGRQTEETLKRRDEESRFLRSAVERYESEQQRLESDVDHAIGESRKLKGLLEETRRELERAQAEIVQARAEIGQARTTLAQAEADRATVEAEREQVRAALQMAEAELARAREDREAAQTEIEQAQAEREQFEATVKKRDISRQRMLAEQAAARVQAEHALADAIARHERLAKQIETLAREYAPERHE